MKNRFLEVASLTDLVSYGADTSPQWWKIISGRVASIPRHFRITSLRGITIRDDRPRPEVNRWI